MTSFVDRLSCVVCERSFDPNLEGTCPQCGDEGILDVHYDMGQVKAALTPESLRNAPPTIWRYEPLLPVEPGGPRPPQPVGFTPIVDAPRIAKKLGLEQVWLKDEGRNPTASFKDRASAIGAARAVAQRAKAIACASTGNAASSLAGMAAGLCIPAYIFVPKRAPEPKLAQLKIFGATVFRVDGTYDEAFDLSQKACEHFGWYNRNCAINPYQVEGKKTAGLEIAEVFGDKIPDWVVVSVGDGCTIAGIWKGLKEMHALGFIPQLPRVLGVQATGAQPLKIAFDQNKDLVIQEVQTIADSICVGHPRNWRKALKAVREAKGEYIAVEDEEILDAMRQAARNAGVFGEPAASAALAGLIKARKTGVVGLRERAVVVITGSGLKDTQSALKAAGGPIDIPPELEAIRPHVD